MDALDLQRSVHREHVQPIAAARGIEAQAQGELGLSRGPGVHAGVAQGAPDLGRAGKRAQRVKVRQDCLARGGCRAPLEHAALKLRRNGVDAHEFREQHDELKLRELRRHLDGEMLGGDAIDVGRNEGDRPRRQLPGRGVRLDELGPPAALLSGDKDLNRPRDPGEGRRPGDEVRDLGVAWAPGWARRIAGGAPRPSVLLAVG